jgi:hypothetical protein
MEDFSGSPTALVADVDCTAGGKDLCETQGVQGYPTIKWGSPDNMEKYEGERSYEKLKEFADENLGPSCGPSSIELCDDEKKALIEKFQKMSDGKLDAKVRKAEANIEKAQTDFDESLKQLQADYEKLQKAKEDTTKKNKESGLGLMKAVVAHKKSGNEKTEL